MGGGETAIAHLYLRLFVDFINNSQKSGANVFYDVCSAFATLLRRIVSILTKGMSIGFINCPRLVLLRTTLKVFMNLLARTFLTMSILGPRIPLETICYLILPRSGIRIRGPVRSISPTLLIPPLGHPPVPPLPI